MSAKPVYLDSIGQILDENGNLVVGVRKYFDSVEDAQTYVDTQRAESKTPPRRLFWHMTVLGYYLDKE